MEPENEVDNITFLPAGASREGSIMECLNHEFKTQPLWTAGIIINGDYSPETWSKETSSVEVTVIWTIHHSLGDGLSMVFANF